MTAFLGLLLTLAWLLFCVWLVGWCMLRLRGPEGPATGTEPAGRSGSGRSGSGRAGAGRSGTGRGGAASRARLSALPEGHRPPPGLGPLSPSERFLTQEAARGVRELQAFLMEQRAA